MHIIGLMRQRLLTLSNGAQEEYKVRNMFRTFDADKSGALSINELAGLFSQLGVDVKENELLAVMKALDKNGNGTVDFEEFYTFLVCDPYTKFKF